MSPLEPNAPVKRILFVLKTYWKKYQMPATDTVSVAAFLVGIDEVAPSPMHEDLWDEFSSPRKFSLLNSIVNHRTDDLLLRDLEKAGLMPRISNYESSVPLPVHTWLDSLPLTRQDWDLLRLIPFLSRFPEHHEHDFLIPWVARELVALWKATKTGTHPLYEGDPENQLQPATYVEAVDLLEEKAPAIAQWAQETRTDINRVNLAQAFEAVAKYRFKVGPVPQGHIAYRFDDGWTVQDLRTKKELEREGKYLQHCVGGYDSAVASGVSRIYSLRDPDGRPFVTMEWEPANSSYWYPEAGGGRHQRYASMDAAAFNDPTPTSLAAQFRRNGKFIQVFGKQNCSLTGNDCDEWLQELGVPKQTVVDHVATFVRALFDGEPFGLLLAGVPAKQINFANVDIEDMSDYDLSGADLRRATFVHGSTLRMARDTNFAGADLRGVDFNRADLFGADFTNANLSRAEMESAICENADFTHANLMGTDLSRADLHNADLSNIEIDSRTDFTNAKDIDVSLAQLQKWGNEMDLPLFDIFGQTRNGFVRGVGYDFFKDRQDGIWKTAAEKEAEEIEYDREDNDDDE